MTNKFTQETEWAVVNTMTSEERVAALENTSNVDLVDLLAGVTYENAEGSELDWRVGNAFDDEIRAELLKRLS